VHRLAILLTVHNRKSKTLACLETVFKQKKLPKDLVIQVLLVDDGCSDGTIENVQAQFPTVRILPGTGNLFWCGGMRLAFETALNDDLDFYLWLNDDTTLFPDALVRMLTTSAQFSHQSIIVASIQDPDSGKLTYGGVKRTEPWRPTRFYQIHPAKQPVSVETMNGNCVLIPSMVARKIGNLDPAFTHGLGDYDYGLRAQKAAIKVYLAPGYYGFCKRNININAQKISLQMRWKNFTSYKGLPPKEWLVFTKRYAGMFWFIFWLSPYLKQIFPSLYSQKG
jgi:GT2 family glycosyltransferase